MAQNLTYTRCGDYLIPDIQLSHTSDKPLGKYGRMRRAFLAENNPIPKESLNLYSASVIDPEITLDQRPFGE